MKKLYYTLKGSSLKGCYFFSKSNFAKAISFGTVMGTLLSSVSPIFAANVAIIGERWVFTDGKWIMNISESGNDSGYEYGSHGSIVFNGHAYYCGVDYVVGRGSGSTENDLDRRKTGGGPIIHPAITAQEQYQRFLENMKVEGFLENREVLRNHPYGTMDKSDSQSSNGGTVFGAGHIGYATGGFSNVQPRAFGIYSFVTGCGAYASGNYSTAFNAGATTKAGGRKLLVFLRLQVVG
ncbi:hypothetical protein V3565_02125 [Bartonella sp. B10]